MTINLCEEVQAKTGIRFRSQIRMANGATQITHKTGFAQWQAPFAAHEFFRRGNLFTASLVIQLRTGGNLADMLELLGHVIRDRRRLFRRVRTLTAQTQLSKRVLVVVPFVLFVMLYVLNPDYLKPLYATSTGVILLLTAGALLGVGTWFMNRIAILRY